MTRPIYVTATAKRDLQDVFDYLLERESAEVAEDMLDGISERLRSLQELPSRGNYPPELERIGIRQYRELHCSLFRVIYEVRDKAVFVHCVLDARRDVQGQLMKRLVR